MLFKENFWYNYYRIGCCYIELDSVIEMENFVSITGPDGSGKSRLAEVVASSLSKDIRIGLIGSIGQAPLIYQNSQTLQYLEGTTSAVESLYKAAQRLRNKKVGLISLGLHSVMIGRFAESVLLHKGAEVIIRDRDPFLDPAVLARVYAQNVPILTLMRIVQATSNNHNTDLLILLNRQNRHMKTEGNPDLHEDHITLDDYRELIPMIRALGLIKDMKEIDNNSNTITQPTSEIIYAIMAMLEMSPKERTLKRICR